METLQYTNKVNISSSQTKSSTILYWSLKIYSKDNSYYQHHSTIVLWWTLFVFIVVIYKRSEDLLPLICDVPKASLYFYVAFQIIGIYLLFINLFDYQQFSILVMFMLSFQRRRVFQPDTLCRVRITINNRTIRQTSMRWYSKQIPHINLLLQNI